MSTEAMKTETPLTDARAYDCYDEPQGQQEVDADFTRALERRLQVAEEALIAIERKRTIPLKSGECRVIADNALAKIQEIKLP